MHKHNLVSLKYYIKFSLKYEHHHTLVCIGIKFKCKENF